MEQSKHCSQCDRCVYYFDHHCLWINNCVGKKNYKLFMLLVFSITIMLLYHISMQLFVLIEYFSNKDKYLANLDEIYQISYDSKNASNTVVAF